MSDGLSVARGGIRFGPGPCPARSPESGVVCGRVDTREAHDDNRHSMGPHLVWSVDATDFRRWLINEHGPEGPALHACEPPDAEWAWEVCEKAGVEPDEGVWRCPVCGWGWELDAFSCYDCGRRDGVDWRRRKPAGRVPERGLFTVGEVGPPLSMPPVSLSSITAAGGWCAPTETIYSLAGLETDRTAVAMCVDLHRKPSSEIPCAECNGEWLRMREGECRHPWTRVFKDAADGHEKCLLCGVLVAL